MRQCPTCERQIRDTAAYCPSCQGDIQRQQKHRIVKGVGIALASLLTAGGVYCTYSYLTNPPPLFITGPVSPHDAFVNRWTLMFGWGVILLAWKLVPWEDRSL